MADGLRADDAPTPTRIGRPSDFTDEIGEAICDRLADGESLRAICEDADMPTRRTVFRWLRRQEHATFCHQYARAREVAGEADADDVGHYSRKAAEGEIEPAAARAAIDGLKWSAGKRQPKKYGDAMQMKHSGAIGAFDPSKMSPDDLRAFIAFIEPLALLEGDAPGLEGGTGEAGG